MEKKALLLSLIASGDTAPDRARILLVSSGGGVRTTTLDQDESGIAERVSASGAQAAAVRYDNRGRTLVLAADGCGIEGLQRHEGVKGWITIEVDELWDQPPARALLEGMAN